MSKNDHLKIEDLQKNMNSRINIKIAEQKNKNHDPKKWK